MKLSPPSTPSLHVLALQVAAVGARVAVDRDLMVADEMLGAVEPEDRATDAGDDLVDTVALDAAQRRRGIRDEHVAQLVDVLGVERPRVAHGEVDDVFTVGHAPQRCTPADPPSQSDA